MIDKDWLVEKSHFNELLSHFYPNQFYSLKDLDITLTKENKLKTTKNLSRDSEGIISTDKSPMFTFSLDKLSELYEENNFEPCYEIIKVSLENLFNYYSGERISVREKIEKIYFKGRINYSTMGFCLKILDLLDNKVTSYRVKRNMDNIYPTSEIFYKRTEKISQDEGIIFFNLVKVDIKQMIYYFIEMLVRIDQDKYNFMRKLYRDIAIFKTY